MVEEVGNKRRELVCAGDNTVSLCLKAAALHPVYGHLDFLTIEKRNRVWESLHEEIPNYATGLAAQVMQLSLRIMRTWCVA